ncbi:Proline-, glutamic acid- and leucine-rich protein 1 [Linnemannia gamsii]|uniref:Pre-rRNA-processing protein RIX1 n=1 Tax=Linnemannia gamsii TaxID=64522 RepID=A0ABQ7K596_9FUNG|nr:Proline-, glutamic acid- and leucine-rich protein 1 [Linnemannia gamsii]
MAVVIQATPTNLLDSLIRRYLKDDLAVRDYVPFVLETITHHRLLHDRNDHPDTTGQQSTQHRIWTQRIRALLESQQPGARFAGVCFVRITAQQSGSMFTDHARTWVTLLVGMLSKHESTANLEAIINTLSELFAKTAKRPDLKSDVTSKYLPDFHSHILNHKDKKDLLPTIYKALTQSVTLFPTTFRLAVDRTEALCVAYMDGRFDMEPEVIKAAATCFAALHAAGGKNPNHPTERITPSEQWRSNVQEVIKAMHRCLNELLATVDEDKADQTEMVGRNKYLTGMPAPAKDAVERYPQLFARFASLSKVLIACLTCSTKEAVHVPLNNLVALLTRVYNTNAKTPMSDARGIDQQEYFILIAGISSVHLAANEVMKTLLATAQDHLVRHMSHLASIAIKSIRHSSGSSSILRSSTYSVIESFIQAFGIPFVNMVQVPLMNALLEDLRMPSARVVNPLEIGAGGSNPNSRANNHTNTTKHKGGAGKNRRGGNTNYANLSALNPLEEIVSAQVFTAALEILSLVLTTSGPNLSPHARAAADTLVVTHLLNSQHHVNPIEQSETPFYTTMVRAQLYKALTASVSSPGETQSSLVPLSVGIFKAGLSDPEKFVRDHCMTALTICDLVMHSRLPPMQRARTITKPLAKGEKAVQEAGTTLFGNFEVAEAKPSSAKAAAIDGDEEEESEEEEEEDDGEEEDEEKDEDVEMEQPKQEETSSITASMTAFKAAGTAPTAAAATTTTTTRSSRKVEEDAQSNSSSIEATKTVSSTSATAAISDKAMLSKTTTTTTTTTTLLAKTSSVSAPVLSPVAAVTAAAAQTNGADDLDDDDIPEINMEDDDDDDEDMDSD